MTKADLLKLLARYDDDALVLLPAGAGFSVIRTASAVRVKPATGPAAAAADWMNAGAAGAHKGVVLGG